MPRTQVIGCGSLLSEASARRTAPTLEDFRVVRVHGFVRVFNKVSPRWARRDGRPDGVAVAVLAAHERPGASFLGTAFRVDADDLARLEEREHHYRWVDAPFEERDGRRSTGRLCAEWTDEAYRRERCVSDEEYEERVGRHYDGLLWRDDVLPSPSYLDLCLDAARSLGEEVYEDFLATTYLADGATTIGSHLGRG